MKYKKLKIYSILALMIALVLIMAACENMPDIPGSAEFDVVIEVVEEDSGDSLEDANVELIDYNGNTKIAESTEDAGVYKFKDVELEINSDFPVTVTKEGYAKADIILTADSDVINTTVQLQKEEDIDLSNAKLFAENLRNHGIDLTNLGKDQMRVAEESSYVMAEYAEGLSYRFYNISFAFERWFEILEHEDYQMMPGDYTITIDDEGYYSIDGTPDNYEDIKDDTNWEWNLTISPQNRENDYVDITMTNLQNVYQENNNSDEYDYEAELNLTEGLFKYEQYSDEDTTLDWNFSFNLSSQDTDIYEQEYFYDNYSEKFTVVYPVDPSIEIDGFMSDSLHNIIPEYSDIGTLTMDITLDANLENGFINYTGSLDSPVFAQSGTTEIDFENFSEFIDNPEEELPQINKIETSEYTEVKDFYKTDGQTVIQFTQVDNINGYKVSLPQDISFSGNYEDLTEEDGVIFNGSMNLILDYTGYNFEETESEDNYIPADLEINAGLEKADFDDVNMELIVDRTGYQELDIIFDYQYEGNQYIQGRGNINEGNIGFDLLNEMNQKIVIYSGEDNYKIGELLNNDGIKLAEIYADDDITFEFIDQDVISIIPDST